MKSYIDLDVWKGSRELVREVYDLTRNFPKEEQYGLSSQMRRCAVSVPSNIAEGSGRNYAKDSIQFFFIARGSLYELETQLYLSFDQEYCSEVKLNALIGRTSKCKQMLNGLINYYEKLPN
jgi:four helix bundle protein